MRITTLTTLTRALGVLSASVLVMASSPRAQARDSLHGLVLEIGRATDEALHHLQDSLVRQHRWKPRGYDGKLWSSMAKLEKYGDSMDKAYHGRDPMRDMHEVALAMTKQIAGVHHWARFAGAPPCVYGDLRRIEGAVAAMCRLTEVHHGGRERPGYDCWDGRDDGGYHRGAGYDGRGFPGRGRDHRVERGRGGAPGPIRGSDYGHGIPRGPTVRIGDAVRHLFR